jgi:hypothetical protein
MIYRPYLWQLLTVWLISLSGCATLQTLCLQPFGVPIAHGGPSAGEAGMEKESSRGAVALSHFLLRERVEREGRVLDATCGNGNDTLFLARLVGQKGKVWANRQLNHPSSVPYVVLIEKVRT